MKPTSFLFVYGSLKPGLDNDMSVWLAENSSIIGSGSMPGNLYLVSDYPAAVYDSRSSDLVKGVVVELMDPENCFSVLDAYEGISVSGNSNDEYVRVIRPVFCEDLMTRACWVYLYHHAPDNLQRIVSGCFGE